MLALPGHISNSMADAIFISYRRDDTQGESGRLFDDLTRAFGPDNVFMDVADIRPGTDFRTAIETQVFSCGIFLAVIGPAWATIQNADGTRRLDDPNDFVVLEIAVALKRDIPVIPILVHNALMPAVSTLPPPLRDLAYRNAVEISHTRWSSDVRILIDALEFYVHPAPAEPVAPPDIHPPPAPQTPQPAPLAQEPSHSASHYSRRIILAICAFVVLTLSVTAYIAFTRKSADVSTPTSELAPFGTTPSPAPASPLPSSAESHAARPASPNPQKPTSHQGSISVPVPLSAIDQKSPAAALESSTRKVDWWVPPNRTGPPQGSFHIHGGTSTGFPSRLDFVTKPEGLSVHVFAACPGKPCDWGYAPVTMNGNDFTTTLTTYASDGTPQPNSIISGRPYHAGFTVTYRTPSGAGFSELQGITFFPGANE